MENFWKGFEKKAVVAEAGGGLAGLASGMGLWHLVHRGVQNPDKANVLSRAIGKKILELNERSPTAATGASVGIPLLGGMAIGHGTKHLIKRIARHAKKKPTLRKHFSRLKKEYRAILREHEAQQKQKSKYRW